VNGLPGFVSPFVAQPYKNPCRVLPNPDSYAYCNNPSGEHTALDQPVCDECWEFIRVA
jgi:hypothetical protein